MQINVGHLNENGVFDGNYSTFALAGRVRAMVRTVLGAAAAQLLKAKYDALVESTVMLLASADICLLANVVMQICRAPATPRWTHCGRRRQSK